MDRKPPVLPTSPPLATGISGLSLLLGLLCLTIGCQTFDHYDPTLERQTPPPFEPPRELAMVSHPSYRLAPPDMISITMLDMIPRKPTRVENQDGLGAMVVYQGADFDDYGQRIDRMVLNSRFQVDLQGMIELPSWGKVRVAGMTEGEIKRHLKKLALGDLARESGLAWGDDELESVMRQMESGQNSPADVLAAAGLLADDISVELLIWTTPEYMPLSGVYMLSQDGTVSLRQYGSVYLAGMTLNEGKAVIEKHLSQFFDSPEVWLDVAGYNSKYYYIVIQGAGMGDTIPRVPITGNETVLDALTQVRGFSQLSSKKVYIARPTPGGFGCEQVLPIDYEAIAYGGSTATNYQIMPGDRVVIVEDPLAAAGNFIARISAPIERVVGFGSLFASSIRNFQSLGRGYNRGRGYGGVPNF